MILAYVPQGAPPTRTGMRSKSKLPRGRHREGLSHNTLSLESSRENYFEDL